uniref:Uncharacterized protein n=1 Tax=Bactrocera latifrons TaxID=174628 RepID=A0A0K8TX48_BACLA
MYIILSNLTSKYFILGKKKSNASDAKNNTKKSTKNPAEKDENNGQISVLELLELQARARAIRSQLALEPVTKIELDSDPEKRDGKKSGLKSTNGTTPKEHKRKRRRKSSEKSKDAEKSQTSSSKAIKETARADTKTPSISNVKVKSKEDESQTTKTTKMKRNYRVSNQEPESGVSESENKSKNKESLTVAKDVKAETKSRSPTPDVIPIIPEPETLFISDSSDGEHNEKDKKKTTPVGCVKNGTENKVVNATSRERKLTEPEEGELIESQTENDQQDDHMEANEPSVGSSATENTESATKLQKIDDVTAETNKSENHNAGEVGEKVPDSAAISTEANIATTNAELPKKEEQNLAPSLEDEDDGNDDVISLEGGDLEEEMIEHLEEDTNTKSSFATSPNKANTVNEEQDADVISLDSSEEDEQEKTSSESWHSRYLKSSKVSKVLATSRLGKRVRDNIKKSKRSKKDTERVKVADEKEKPSPSYASKHEDGSIEQYKELLAMRQRKK